MTFPALQLPFNGLPDEVSAPFVIPKNGVHAVESAGGEPGRNLLVVDLFSAHAKIYLISPNLTSPSECDIIYLLDGRADMDKRIDEIEPVEGGFLMVHLKYGYYLNDPGTHTFGADNKREVRSTMKMVKPCGCSECKQAHTRG
jgi:hypothetical protein